MRRPISFALASVLAAAPASALLPPHDSSNGLGCPSCHAVHGAAGQAFMPTAAVQEALCKSCHNPTGQAASMADVAVHTVDGGTRILYCGDCHDPHSPSTSVDPHAGGAGAPNLSLLRSDVRAAVTGALSPLVFQQRPAQFAFGTGAAPWDGACQACHSATTHHTRDASADHSHFMGAVCTQCHAHGRGFASGSPHSSDFGTGSVHGPLALADIVGCESCHGASLAGTTGVPSCNQCHGGWRTNCVFCHGGKENATGAPPNDTHGQASTALLTVGAHGSHLMATGPAYFNFPRVACSECHVVPTDALSAGHIDAPNASVTFGPLATRSGGPSWDRASATCSNVYCHGPATPQWTRVDGTQAACGSCHDVPPGDTYYGYPHGGFNHYDGDHMAFVCGICHPMSPSTHINGSSDINGTASNCDCH